MAGAVAESAGWANTLWHNHAAAEDEPWETGEAGTGRTLADGYVYRYPLIQFRVIDGQAALFGIGEGVDHIKQWLAVAPPVITMGPHTYPLLVMGMYEDLHPLRLTEQWHMYRLMDYVPFHTENYRRWRDADNYSERIELLENVLAGHLLGFCSAMDYRLPARLEARLLLVREMRTVRVHGVAHLGFNLVYKTNLDLPAAMALGKSIAFGYGLQMPVKGE